MRAISALIIYKTSITFDKYKGTRAAIQEHNCRFIHRLLRKERTFLLSAVRASRGWGHFVKNKNTCGGSKQLPGTSGASYFRIGEKKTKKKTNWYCSSYWSRTMMQQISLAFLPMRILRCCSWDENTDCRLGLKKGSGVRADNVKKEKSRNSL